MRNEAGGGGNEVGMMNGERERRAVEGERKKKREKKESRLNIGKY